MSSNLKVNSLVPATGTEIGIGTTGGTIDFRCPATFGGNVTIGGTLTYDEVINIDSIGIVTARSGLKVTGGQLDVGSNIKAGNAGVITATSFVGSGANLTSLPAQATIANNADNRVITGGSGVNLNGESGLTYDGTAISVTGSGNFIKTSNNYILVGSSNAGGASIVLDGDSNGDGGGTDYAYIEHDTSGDLNIVGDNPANASNIIFKTNSTSERFRIASNGNVSIGNNPSVHSDTLFHVEKSGETNVKFEGNTTTLGARLSLQNNNTAAGALNQIDFNDAGGQSTSSIKGFNTDQTNNYGDLAFFTRSAQGSPPAERLRIRSTGQVDFASRNFTMGTQSDSGASTGITGNAWSNNEIGIKMSHRVSGGQSFFVFYNTNGQVGYIQSSGSGTIYNTGSDYRLKENQVLISDGITRLKQLKPYRFNFKKDPSTTLDGFFAHEVQSVVPEAIAGTKDEVATKDEGDRKIGDPILQGMDYGRITPLLTAALQEAISKIEVLEAKVAALEGS